MPRFWKLSHRESLALQAMVRRVGIAAVLDDLTMLADEMGAEWQDVAGVLHEAREEALKALALESCEPDAGLG